MSLPDTALRVRRPAAIDRAVEGLEAASVLPADPDAQKDLDPLKSFPGQRQAVAAAPEQRQRRERVDAEEHGCKPVAEHVLAVGSGERGVGADDRTPSAEHE